MNKLIAKVQLYGLLLILLTFSGCSSSEVLASSDSDDPDNQIMFPRAYGIAINQVGYMQGSNIGEGTDGPWRAGIRRNFDVRDYQPIVEVGREVGVRFMSLFALAEMDRLNVVANYPTVTMWGSDFDNSENIGPEQLEIMDYVKSNASHIELAVTGVGHEYWIDGKKIRSEWYNVEDQQPWPEKEMYGRTELIQKILAQYGISPENGHSFPESMSAYGYHWNPDGNFSTGKVWSDAGVKYGNTKFELSPEIGFPESGTGGFDHGVLVFDRFDYGNDWYTYADLPDLPPDIYETDLIESHWANWLAADDWLQPDLNDDWINYFRTIQAHPNHYLAKNTEQLYSQWLYLRHTSVTENEPGTVTIDNRNMVEQAYTYDMLGNMVLTVELDEGQHISRATLNGDPVPAYFEEAGYGFIYLPPLDQDVYELIYEIGSDRMPVYVNNTGTYNVYGLAHIGQAVEFEFKMYGTQTVKIKTRRPADISSDNDYLKILSQEYDADRGLLLLEVYGRDLQGEKGTITLRY